MRRILAVGFAACLLAAAPAFSGTTYTYVETTYDIESNHVLSYASFNYVRSLFDGTEYRFETVQVLHPYTWSSDVTFQDSWSRSIGAGATEGECSYTLFSVQRFDPGAGFVEGRSDQSSTVCAPRRCLFVVYESWPEKLRLISARYVPLGSTYSYTAYDYPDLVFVAWEGNVQSTDRTISGTIEATSFTLFAVYDFSPPPPPPEQPGGELQPPCNPCTPIVINFSNGAYRLSGAEAPVLFDIKANGQPVWMGWTAGGADEAFLSVDLDGNGVIDHGAELFGNATRLRSGERADNGFIALADSDENHDGVIDYHDAIWQRLLLWGDLNHDGISQAAEIQPVVGSRLAAISLDYHWTGRRDSSGNLFRYQSHAWISHDGKRATPRPVYDIIFVSLP